MNIKIPNRLNKSIKDTDWDSIIRGVIKNVSAILASQPEMFSTYTVHTVNHINNVLDYCDKLMPRKAKLSPDAAGVLVLSVLLHDSGMFIPRSGLKKLLDEEKKKPLDEEKKKLLDEENWGKRWEEYQTQLRHYSDSDLLRSFGAPPEGVADPRKLPTLEGMDNLTEWEKRLCGEYLRRYHHELSRKICTGTFPAQTNMDFFRGVEIKELYRKLAGLIAYSHGVSLEEAIEKMETDCKGDCNVSEPGMIRGVPVVYLMTLLRMADYLDAGEDRAPWTLQALNGLGSEISQMEWEWNRFVETPSFKSKFQIEIDVEDSVQQDGSWVELSGTVFQKIEDWLKSLQSELDICWRYLALRYPGSSSYKLSALTIVSNAFRPQKREEWAEKIVLEPAQLCAAPEILGLLAAPLYGNNPSYGVRELLQNAVDACKERKTKENADYHALVKVALTTGEEPSFVIEDNGIGMTKEVILNYFLKAGSSYRNSLEWQTDYGEKGVARSGRFGIGVLAAFLLGDRVKVETVPRGEKLGYCFTIVKGRYQSVDVKRFAAGDSLQQGGTRITVEMEKAIAQKMAEEHDWRRWYWLPEPEVSYTIDGQAAHIDDRFYEEFVNLQYGNRVWFPLESATSCGFSGAWWTPEGSQYTRETSWHNGFRVREQDFEPTHSGGKHQPEFVDPHLAIEDGAEKCDLSLDRNHLQGLPKACLDELAIELLKFQLAALMLWRVEMGNHPLYGIGAWRNALLIKQEGYSADFTAAIHGGERIWAIQDGIVLPLQLLKSLPKEDIVALPGRFYRLDLEIFEESLYTAAASRTIGIVEDGKLRTDKGVSDEELRILLEMRERYRHFACYQLKPKENDMNPAMRKVVEEYLGEGDRWIPYALPKRREKFPRFFDPADKMYRYMEFISEYGDEAYYYRLSDLGLPEDAGE